MVTQRVPRQKERCTPEEYLAFERSSEAKHEYIAGEVVAMSGASRRHNRITLNIGSTLEAQFADRACEAFVSDMRVRVIGTGAYVYPDVVTVCGEPRFEDAELDTLLNPTLIVEALSPSTEAYDRDAKFTGYQTIGTMTDYLLVAQNTPRVEHFRMLADPTWDRMVFTDLREIVPLESIGCTLPLADVYRKVTW